MRSNRITQRRSGLSTVGNSIPYANSALTNTQLLVGNGGGSILPTVIHSRTAMAKEGP